MANYDGPYLMGIDYGTESCRVVLVDIHGRPITFAATPYKTTHPHGGWAEQNPEEWWEALQASTRKVLAASGISPNDIAGISYDATSMTVVAMDEKGQELRPAIMWMDVRATKHSDIADTVDHWAKKYNGDGTAPATAEWYPFKAAWLAENEPETFNKAYRLVDAPDWLTFKLTGEWTTNINSAAHRMYYNRDEGGWPVEFYEAVGCPADVFDKIPENVVDLGTPIGGLSTIAAQLLGLKPGTPVAQGCVDAWAGQIGLGVVEPGKLFLTTGSSHVLGGQSATPLHGNGFFGSYTDGVVKGQYTVEGAQVSTGSALKWFKDNFCKDIVKVADETGLSPYDILNMQSKDIPIGSNGLVINEYFSGNRTPYTDPRARAIFAGLSLAHGPAHVYHALQEAVCFGTEHNLRALRAAGMETNEMVACGGATKSRAWMQMHADVTGVPITLTEVGDAVALGSAMLAAVGAGIYSSIQEAAKNMVHEIDRIQPDQARHDEYKFYVDKYTEIYPALRGVIHELVEKQN